MRGKTKKSHATAGRVIHHRWRLGGFEYLSDTISHDYMRRRILRTPWGMLRLHHILRSDKDRHFHDHPMDFVTLILRTGYVEHTPLDLGDGKVGVKIRYVLPGDIVFHRAEDLHYLKLLGRDAWTLVLAGPYRRDWGFETEDGWIASGDYDDWLASKASP